MSRFALLIRCSIHNKKEGEEGNRCRHHSSINFLMRKFWIFYKNRFDAMKCSETLHEWKIFSNGL